METAQIDNSPSSKAPGKAHIGPYIISVIPLGALYYRHVGHFADYIRVGWLHPFAQFTVIIGGQVLQTTPYFILSAVVKLDTKQILRYFLRSHFLLVLGICCNIEYIYSINTFRNSSK